jgi:hypothetical protein
MESMPSTQRAKAKGAVQTSASHAERNRQWVETDDFETAPA